MGGGRGLTKSRLEALLRRSCQSDLIKRVIFFRGFSTIIKSKIPWKCYSVLIFKNQQVNPSAVLTLK